MIISDKSSSALQEIVKGYESIDFFVVKDCLTELRKRGIEVSYLDEIAKFFMLNSTDQLFNVLLDNDIDKQDKIENLKISNEELIPILNKIFEHYKYGFAYIMFANLIGLITALVSFVLINNTNDLELIKSTNTFVMVVNILCYCLFLFGVVTLFKSSQLKKSKL
jgi:hypothetical protein